MEESHVDFSVGGSFKNNDISSITNKNFVANNDDFTKDDISFMKFIN